MVTFRDYVEDAVEAARSVMIELTHLLGEYRDDIVIIGGWVPPLLLGHDAEHVGSMDVDLALDHRTLSEAGYRTIGQALAGAGYAQDSEQPFIFRKTVARRGREVEVQVDLLAGEYEGTGRRRRTQRTQDVRPRKARGCDLAFDGPVDVCVKGTLPDGSMDSVLVRVAAIGPFIAMKGMAMRDRLKQKDPYDIYFLLRNAPMDDIIKSVRFLRDHGLVREALGIISEKFATPDHVGPQHVADFLEEHDPEMRDILVRDAYERVQALLRALTEST
jgi:hypothetical protein